MKGFQTGMVPVSEQETVEIFAFMDPAAQRQRQGGAVVRIDEVMARAANPAEPTEANRLKPDLNQ